MKYKLNQPISRTKEYFSWLVITQLTEIAGHRTRRKIANEFCDIILVAVQAVEHLGYDVPVAMWKRLAKHNKRGIASIVRRYEKTYKELKNNEKP